MIKKILNLALEKQDWDLVKLVIEDLKKTENPTIPPIAPIPSKKTNYTEDKTEAIIVQFPITPDKPNLNEDVIPSSEFFKSKIENKSLSEFANKTVEMAAQTQPDKSSKISNFTTQIKRSSSAPIIADGKNYGRKLSFEPVNNVNLFEDTLAEERGDTKQSNPQLEILYGNKRRKKRESVESPFVKVKCSGCNRTEEVSPILAVGYSDIEQENTYKCNQCIQNMIKGQR